MGSRGAASLLPCPAFGGGCPPLRPPPVLQTRVPGPVPKFVEGRPSHYRGASGQGPGPGQVGGWPPQAASLLGVWASPGGAVKTSTAGPAPAASSPAQSLSGGFLGYAMVGWMPHPPSRHTECQTRGPHLPNRLHGETAPPQTWRWAPATQHSGVRREDGRLDEHPEPPSASPAPGLLPAADGMT